MKIRPETMAISTDNKIIAVQCIEITIVELFIVDCFFTDRQ